MLTEPEQKVDIKQKHGTSSSPMPPNMLGNHTDTDAERSSRKPFEIKMRYKRQTLQDMTRPLKTWLYKNRDNPYPTKAEKMGLAADSNMTLTQVSNWFANARRRLKNTVSNPDLSWGKRVKMYNSCVKGNQELLSISSEDSAWESGEDGETKTQQDGTTDPLTSRLSASPHQPLVCYPATSQSPAEHPVSPSMLPLNLSRSATVTTVPLAAPSVMSQQQQQQQQQNGRSPEQAHKIVTEMLQQHLFQQQQQQQQQQAQQHEIIMEHDQEEEQEAEPEDRQFHAPCAPDCGNHGLMPGEVDQPGKFKHSILQRYLQDSYKHNITLTQQQQQQQQQQQHHNNSHNSSLVNSTSHRHRNPSGSLSSHDYEDVSLSSRSTPTRDMMMPSSSALHYDAAASSSVAAGLLVAAAAAGGSGSGGVGSGSSAGSSGGSGVPGAGEIHRLVGEEELWRQWPQIENKANEDLHWKEISAALALTALSRGEFSRLDNKM